MRWLRDWYRSAPWRSTFAVYVFGTWGAVLLGLAVGAVLAGLGAVLALAALVIIAAGWLYIMLTV